MPKQLPEINLLPKYERQSERLYQLFVFLIAFILLAIILLGVFYFTTKNKLTTAENDYEQLKDKEDLLQVEMDQLEMGEDFSLADAVTFVEHRSLKTSNLITHIDQLLPENSYVSNYSYGSQGVSINTQFKTLGSVANYTTELINSDYINDTKINEVGAVSSEDDSDEISSYEAHFMLDINREKLKKESKSHE